MHPPLVLVGGGAGQAKRGNAPAPQGVAIRLALDQHGILQCAGLLQSVEPVERERGALLPDEALVILGRPVECPSKTDARSWPSTSR